MKQFFQCPQTVPYFIRNVTYRSWNPDVQGMHQSITMMFSTIACNVSAVLSKPNLRCCSQWTEKRVRDRE
jgi:hypothetical protein